MRTFRLENCVMTLGRVGLSSYTKVSYPVRYGCYNEIRTSGLTMQFTPTGEIRYLQGNQHDWPHPAEWLKRTQGHDWVYYSAGHYNDVFDLLGEYYLPCFTYSTNTIFTDRPFDKPGVQRTLYGWEQILQELAETNNLPDEADAFLKRALANTDQALAKRAARLRVINKGRVTVLPPDTRQVDYNVIPLLVEDGCLHNCGFCEVKTSARFSERTDAEIDRQLQELAPFYGEDLANYNSIFLGQHDTLAVREATIIRAAEKAFTILQLGDSRMKGAFLFLFGSVQSFLKISEACLAQLNRLPYYTYINLGFESADQSTLNHLQKPVEAAAVRAAFDRMVRVNCCYERLEVSGNFVMGEDLPAGHWQETATLVSQGLPHPYAKGCLYFSPLRGRSGPGILPYYRRMQRISRLPVALYVIQRL